MELRPLRNYKGVKYPTLEQYLTRKPLKNVARAIVLAAALAALTTLMGCIRGYS